MYCICIDISMCILLSHYIGLLEGTTGLAVHVTSTNTVTTIMIIYQNNIDNNMLSKHTL